MKIIIWGSGEYGKKCFDALNSEYEIIAWGDSSNYKHNTVYRGIEVLSEDEVQRKYNDISVVVALYDYYEQAKHLMTMGLNVIGRFDVLRNTFIPWEYIEWKDALKQKHIFLYAGDIYYNFDKYPEDMICLSIEKKDYKTILHDINNTYPIPDNSVDKYQIEDVIEHIEKESFIKIINEIYRVLKPGGYLRLSMPDYNSPLKKYNSFINPSGEIVFDPDGGGKFHDGKVKGGGHLWFPTYEKVNSLLNQTNFTNIKYYRYYDENGELYSEKIDYSLGYINRTAENLIHGKDISIVVDCYKNN